ncbi:MAG: alpha/beta fold hydrolase [Promethearchaeota archaeon]
MEIYSPEKGFEIAYKISGDSNKPKMVLIHGLFINSDSWYKLLPVFESEFHVLRYDLRGHGRTTKPKKRFTVRNYTEDLHALLNHLNWTTDLYLVGHSLGGIIALAYPILYPSHVKKMVVADGFCFVSQEAMTDVLGRINTYKVEDFQIVKKMVIDHMTKKDLIQATMGSAGVNICENLKELNFPVLVLVGKKDITCPVWASEMIHEWLPQSELVIIPNAGHLTILDHPKEFNDLTISFWKK